jgi:[ribosomal protein S5]-alanine N-acetyltransferase
VLRSDSIRLRPLQQRDLDTFYAKFNNLDYRGSFFPLGLQSEAKFHREFSESGFWDKDEGMLLIVTPDDEIAGEIEYFPITNYLVGYELSYLIFGPEHAGKGYATDAVRLLTEYLFARLRTNRLQLNIHPDNVASRRVATKAGYTLEGVMRGCWWHRGRYHDLEIWSMLRAELPGAP